MAGLTLGGGIGWMMRKHGLTNRYLARVEVVTADGALVRASAEENPGPFWGVRGGGGNFGIVTAFEFRLHPAGPTSWPARSSGPWRSRGALLRFYRDWIADAPDELMTMSCTARRRRGRSSRRSSTAELVVDVDLLLRRADRGRRRVLRAAADFGSPVLDLCVPKPYLAHQAMFDPSFLPGRWYYLQVLAVAG